MPKRNIVARTHPRPQSLRFFLSRGRRNVNDILRRVALGTRIARTWQNNYNTMQHLQMLHEKSDHFQISANNSQHVATRRHRVAKRRQHVAPNNVAICCVEMLRSFGRDLTSMFVYVSLNWLTCLVQTICKKIFFTNLHTRHKSMF